MRTGNGAISFAGTVIAGLSVLGLSQVRLPWDLVQLVLAGTTTFLVTSAGNVLNDYLDREGDKLNHPDRPLPKGEVTPGEVRRFSIALFVLSVVPLVALAIIGAWRSLVQPLSIAETALIWAGAVALLLGYELRWKARGLVGNLAVALLTGAVFLFGASTVGLPWLALPWTAMAALATLSREIIKDTEDMAGDVDRSTLPRTHGVGVASWSARAAVAAAIALSPLPLILWLSWSSAAGIMYSVLVAAADLVFVLSIAWLPARLHTEQSLSKLGMVLALLAFLGASLR